MKGGGGGAGHVLVGTHPLPSCFPQSKRHQVLLAHDNNDLGGVVVQHVVSLAGIVKGAIFRLFVPSC